MTPPESTITDSEPPSLAKPRLHYWPIAIAGLAIYYYLYSVMTLPFVDEIWLGEIPPLALVQIPKARLNDAVQDFFISLLPGLGQASGSPSPDMILTHPWALGVTVTAPALIVILTLALLPKVAYRHWLILSVAVAAALDAAVTFWFDATSRLSIF